MSISPNSQEIMVPADAPLGVSDYGQGNQPAPGLGHLLLILRHHWPIAAIAWPLFMAISIPIIWLVLKPEYTATATIKVDPVMSTLLDSEMRTMPLFDSYLASQAQLMTTGPVLNSALADSRLKGLPILNEPNAVSLLREKLSVAPVPRTQIIRVDVTDADRRTAILLADAVLNSYMTAYGGTTEIDERINYLLKREQELKDALSKAEAKKLEAARVYNATTDSMFEKLREIEAKRSEQLVQQIEATNLQILQLEEEIKRLEADSDSSLDDVDPAQQRAFIENSPLVRSLREQILAESARLVRLRSGLTDEAPAVMETQALIDSLNEQLNEARKQAGETFKAELVEQRQSLKENRKRLLQAQLVSAREIEAKLRERAKEQENKDRNMGQTNIQIQAAQQEIDALKKDLAEVEEARKKQQVAKDQPGRVTIASHAEIWPDGVNDKRVKLTGAAVFGCLCAALGLTFLRGKLDARVYVPDQVESGTGLHILGVVPAVSDLKRGRVCQEDFAEAYRLVRVNMLSRVVGDPPKTILVTSAHASEGKTSLAISLAVSLAELGGRVLLIDGDAQAPRIGRLLGIKGDHRLRHVLSGERDLASAAVPSKLANLDVLLGGVNGDSAKGLIEQNTTSRLVAQARSLYDFVVIDSSPALGTADSTIWSQAADGVVLSTLAGYSDLGATRYLCDRLGMVGARILGAVVCNVTMNNGYSTYSSHHSSMSRARSRMTDPPSAALYLPQLQAAGQTTGDGDSNPPQKKAKA